ncbi:MAG TPA: hypothetical protein VHN36_20490 [Ilumatobacteraceae bacterium]|nr:hypothetical protein [Ilumatobacteraceae bacterium]
MPWVVDITAYVNANSPLEVTCWAGTFGYPIGTVAWSTFVDSQATLAAATSALLSQDGYFDRLDAAAEFVTTPGQDLLREVVYGSPADPPPVGAVAQITTATALVDRLADAVGWAVEIAQYLEGVIGSPIGVLTDVYGTIGSISWIGVVPDAAASDASRAKIAADTSYLGRLVATKDLFIPGSGHVGQVTRIV